MIAAPRMLDAASAGSASRVRRAIGEGIIHRIVTTPELWASVEISTVKALLRGLLENVPRDALTLVPLWDHLSSRGACPLAATELIRVVDADVARWGVRIILPWR